MRGGSPGDVNHKFGVIECIQTRLKASGRTLQSYCYQLISVLLDCFVPLCYRLPSLASINV
jgi:hypothetical protein